MVQTPQRTVSPPTLEELVNNISRYETMIDGWDENQQVVVRQLKGAIETLHKEALARLIRSVKQDAIGVLRNAIDDEVVYGVLHYHELIKPPQPPLAQRLQRALDEIRPMLKDHNGDVELVSIRLPDTIEVRFIGTCRHCPASSLTLTQRVEQTIKQHCPEIEHVVVVRTVITPHPDPSEEEPISADQGWRLVTSLAEIPEGGLLDLKIEGRSLILSRFETSVTCFHNACSHLGVPLDSGEIHNGVLTCPYHGFRYLLMTGDCLSAPDVPLQHYPVRVQGGSVFVQLRDQ
jgi:nitrite reductase/ring-hydroxylating ferredoxin subunit/Fe-S cluster biogenesis protein NfuA